MDIKNLSEKEREALLSKLQAEKKKKGRGPKEELPEAACQIPRLCGEEAPQVYQGRSGVQGMAP